MPPIDPNLGPHMLVPKNSLPWGYVYGERLTKYKDVSDREEARIEGYIQGTDRGRYLMAKYVKDVGSNKKYTKKERLRIIKATCRRKIKSYEND